MSSLYILFTCKVCPPYFPQHYIPLNFSVCPCTLLLHFTYNVCPCTFLYSQIEFQLGKGWTNGQTQ